MAVPGTSAFINDPGIYNDAQIAAWKQVTDAVQAKGAHLHVDLARWPRSLPGRRRWRPHCFQQCHRHRGRDPHAPR